MNSTDLIKLSRHPEFRDRVLLMVSYVCHEIMKEDSETPKTAERKRYASMTLNNSTGYLERWSVSLSANRVIAENINISGTTPLELEYTGTRQPVSVIDGMDVEIMDVINVIFNGMAGVY